MNMRSVFNPTSGYVNYVIPAVFVLILHQTLVMGAGIVGAAQNEERKKGVSGYWDAAPPLRLLFARTFVFISIYWGLCMYYFGFSLSFYNIPRVADFAELNLVILPFLLAAALLGVCLGLVLPRKELSTLVVLVSSIPLIFGSGFIWPVESIPLPISAVFQYIPVVPAIKMFVSLNQMGADFSSLMPVWVQLWRCVLVYGVLAWWLLLLPRVTHLCKTRQF